MLTRISAKRRANIQSALGAVREHRNAHETVHLLALLDALIEDTMFDLATVELERTTFTQGALAQLNALRDAIASDEPHKSAKAA